MAAPNVGLLIPGPSVGDMPRPDEYTAFFRAADEMGFHSSVGYRKGGCTASESGAALYHAGGCALPSLPAFTFGYGGGAGFALRHPISLANDVASVDYLSGGRMNLGPLAGRQAGGVRSRGRPHREADGPVRGDAELAASLVDRG